MQAFFNSQLFHIWSIIVIESIIFNVEQQPNYIDLIIWIVCKQKSVIWSLFEFFVICYWSRKIFVISFYFFIGSVAWSISGVLRLVLSIFL